MRSITGLDEMVRPNVGHDFRAGQDLDMELILDGLDLLMSMSMYRPVNVSDMVNTHPRSMSCFHDGSGCCEDWHASR